MQHFYILIAWILLAIGVAGCFIPMLPGPPISYVALVMAYAIGFAPGLSAQTLVLAGIATVAVTVLDYVVPAIGAHEFKCSRTGTIGCLVGTVTGLFFLPLGVILGPFFGALIGETTAGKDFGPALLGATGALLGYLFGILQKLLCCGYLIFVFWKTTYN